MNSILSISIFPTVFSFPVQCAPRLYVLAFGLASIAASYSEQYTTYSVPLSNKALFCYGMDVCWF